MDQTRRCDDLGMERIVVGMDGSATAAEALRWAVEEGMIRHLPVTAVLAWSLIDQHHADESVAFEPAYGEADAAAALDAYVASALGDEAAAIVWKDVVCERPAPALVRSAESASLLVVGSRGLGGFRGLLVGSVSQECLHHFACPVVIVRPGARSDDERRRIVVGIDGSATSRRALGWALDEARARQCEIEVVHSWSLPYGYGYPAPLPLDPTAVAAAAATLVDSAIADADTSGLAHPVERILISGPSPGGALLVRAEAADLVGGRLSRRRRLSRNGARFVGPSDRPPRSLHCGGRPCGSEAGAVTDNAT